MKFSADSIFDGALAASSVPPELKGTSWAGEIWFANALEKLAEISAGLSSSSVTDRRQARRQLKSIARRKGEKK